MSWKMTGYGLVSKYDVVCFALHFNGLGQSIAIETQHYYSAVAGGSIVLKDRRRCKAYRKSMKEKY